MDDEFPELTHKERSEFKKLIKQCSKDPCGAVKFTQPRTSSLTGNYYWDRFVGFNLATTVAYDDKWNGLGEPEQLAIAITADGKHYFEKFHDQQIRWLTKSALIPLIISILANTPNWWPMILKWLQSIR
ncbi:hypothetical protein [Secundilactobacillus yichangensis]|uniref:hypothetical protein n=1 Tax=Secundilactobacillus yichangensis TaxID=2799580 RepID=UPI00194210B4|nr:hypothetical protein [Secundilactobacillus yichangensis]